MLKIHYHSTVHLCALLLRGAAGPLGFAERKVFDYLRNRSQGGSADDILESRAFSGTRVHQINSGTLREVRCNTYNIQQCVGSVTAFQVQAERKAAIISSALLGAGAGLAQALAEAALVGDFVGLLFYSSNTPDRESFQEKHADSMWLRVSVSYCNACSHEHQNGKDWIGFEPLLSDRFIYWSCFS
eukprot:SAG31_NODE_25_length_33055_cov_11.407919_6_plen_186_part_00